MPTQPSRVAGCGVDYLTCTYNTQAKLTTLEFYLSRIDRAERHEGNMPRPWSMSGYNGWKVGQLEYGWRHDGVIVRTHSDASCDNWQSFASIATNISRIDLQWTVVYDESPAITLARHLKEMRALWRKHKKFPEPTFWGNASGVNAVYSGSRHSERYLRCYHRWAKEPIPELLGQIRYEAELKGDVARDMCRHLLSSRNAQAEIHSQVTSMFKARGVSLAHVPASCPIHRSPRGSGDVSRRLAWIRNAVRPSIEELVAAGYEVEVRDALGLSSARQAE